ncbi:MAG: HD domain-containing protein [Flavobacteriaceae bacterium]|nr:MAG: HD domain-containing protein [Flavobacteriaceae bacterium]
MNEEKSLGLEGGFQVDLRQTVYALSDALDLVGIDEVHHGKRVGYMAMLCADKLGLDVKSINDLFELGLLHDCGVSSSRDHQQLVDKLDWSEAQEHCRVGHDLLKNFAPLAHMAEPILYHHTHWEDLKQMDLPPELCLLSNLIYLVDRVDTQSAVHHEKDVLLKINDLREFVYSKRESFFDPQLVNAFMDVSSNHAFWLGMEQRHLIHFIADMGSQDIQTYITLEELEQLARIFSRIVDAKSQFTVEHSEGVAGLARYLGEIYGLSPEACEKIGAAALLHDLGKLRVPDEILDKPGPLDKHDRAIIEQHSFETYEILRRIPGLEEIAKWAAYHHETLHGNGYPFHPSTDEMGIEARIIAVADIFQALAQNRPYRKSLPLEKILEIMETFVIDGHLDSMLVNLVKQNGERCYQEATFRDQ